MTRMSTDVAWRSTNMNVDGESPQSQRRIDRIDRRLLVSITALGFGLPVFGYFWFLHHFSVDAVVGDQWDDVTVIKQSYVHFFDWGPMWAQHNENRIFFPNIVVVILAHTAHFNIKIEEFLGAVMLTVATAFLVWAHKRRSPSMPWLFYCPVAFLALSVVQYGNTTWGFQLAWFMVLISLATAVLLLDRETLTWMALLGACLAGVVGSFSSLQGLIIWPTGLVLLYYRRRNMRHFIIWILAGIASAVIYFYHFDFSASPDSGFAREHPLEALKFFLFVIGDVVGKPVRLGTSTADNTLVVVFGLLIVLLAVVTVLVCGVKRDEQSASPVGIALICYGLLFALFVTQGRSYFGYGGASFSRYTTFDLLILVGIYLALLGRSSHAREISMPREDALAPRSLAAGSVPAGMTLERLKHTGATCAWVGIVAVMCIQLSFGTLNGINGERGNYAYNVRAAGILRNVNHAPNNQVARMYPFALVPFIRGQAHVLQIHGLSVFAGNPSGG